MMTGPVADTGLPGDGVWTACAKRLWHARDLAIDTDGHDHRVAAGVTDHRVVICDGDEVLEVHDLVALADERILTPTVHDGEVYAADSPRAWVEAWRTDCCGWNGVLLDESLVGRLVRGVEA